MNAENCIKGRQVRAARLAGWAMAMALLVPAVASAADASEKPFLHPLFSDHAVLQRGVPVPVWGWARPGETVQVSLNGKTAKATADQTGKWLAKIGPFDAGGPYTLEITGRESVKVNDILIGDVWLCSGQSNMEMGVVACEAREDIAKADFPKIRLLTVPHLITTKPQEVVPVKWHPCTPETVTQGVYGGFTAAGFFFGRKLHQELGVPIGLIHSSWGGTIAEAWTSMEGLKPLPDFKERLDQVVAMAETAGQGSSTYSQQIETWYKTADPGTKDGWERTAAGDWKKINLPQAWETAGLPDFDGIVWFRGSFDVPEDWADKELTLSLGPIDDADTTWINGTKVGQTDRYDRERVYKVPAGVAKAGKNAIVIRVLDTGGAGGPNGKPEQMRVAPSGDAQASPVSLAGEWLMRDSAPLAKLPPPPANLENNPNVSTVLYNGMIAPILPYAIKGAIWYQGESNAGRALQYRALLPALIQDWRNRFGVGEFPFYIVQLANFMQVAPEPRDNEWAELREAQAIVAKDSPHCGLAVAIDIGEAKDIHPKNKAEVGRRLALAALAKTYGKNVEYSGPWYKSMEVADKGIRIHFDHVGGGLTAKGDKLTGFAIAGEDRKFVWADAAIDGQTVLVSSPKVEKPVAVRYAWDINPVCNLYNQAGLPAVPFRTDDWPMITQGKK